MTCSRPVSLGGYELRQSLVFLVLDDLGSSADHWSGIL